MSKATMFRSADTSVMSRFSQLRMTTAYDDKGPRNLFLLLLFIVNIFPLVTLADDNPPQSIPSRDNRMSQQQISQMGVSTDWQIPTPVSYTHLTLPTTTIV